MAPREIVLGIDLGTSFSTAAAWVGEKMYLVPDERGEPCIPTVVHFPEGEAPVIGHEAALARRVDPENAVHGIKRILGRDFGSAEARVFAAGTSVTVKAAPNGRVMLETSHGEHSAEEVAAHVYAHLKRLAETRFRARARRAVLTIPASATPESTRSTIRAAEQAGLEVIRTIHEPAAAAIAFGVDRFRGQRRLLVYDFGGGTFDCTLLEQRDSELSPLGVGGDGSLGGDDFDVALAEHAAGMFWRQHRVELQQDVVRWDRVLQEAESTKRGLSAMPAARLRVREAYSAGGRRHDVDLTIGREEIEPRWQTLVQRSLETTAHTMMQANLRPAGVDCLLLVGGTTYIPMVRDAVKRMMSKPGQHPGDPQTSVACGAAIAAARDVRKAA